jgi:competence protein ComEA
MEATGPNDRLRWLLTLLVLGLALAALFTWWRSASRTDPAMLLPSPDLREPQATAPSRSGGSFAVDVVGAVQKPGLYYLAPDSRVDDAIKAAGGLAPDANREAVNFATRLKDEQQLRVPRVGEGSQRSAGPVAAATAEVARIDVNTADAQTLEALPGIGSVTARQIVAYRTAHGPFQSVDQLDDVPGIGAATIDALRDLVTVENR